MPLKRLPSEKEIMLELMIRTDRSDQFRSLIRDYGEIVNVVEVKSDPINSSNGLLLFMFICKPGNKDKVEDIAFMSFVNNAKMNKYYDQK